MNYLRHRTRELNGEQLVAIVTTANSKFTEIVGGNCYHNGYLVEADLHHYGMLHNDRYLVCLGGAYCLAVKGKTVGELLIDRREDTVIPDACHFLDSLTRRHEEKFCLGWNLLKSRGLSIPNLDYWFVQTWIDSPTVMCELANEFIRINGGKVNELVE